MEKFEQFITHSEIERPRTPVEYICWFESKLKITEEFKKNLRKQGLLHKGIAKHFYEELFPLYRLLQNNLNGWGQLKVLPKIGNQNHDVQIISNQTDVPRYLEITSASLDQNEHYRMEYFAENKSVDLFGEVKICRKPERKISVGSGLIRRDYADRQQKDRIISAIEKKLGAVDREPRTALLVYFDDYTYFRYDDEKSKYTLNEFLDALPGDWRDKYERLYLLGVSGKSLFERAVSTLTTT